MLTNIWPLAHYYYGGSDNHSSMSLLVYSLSIIVSIIIVGLYVDVCSTDNRPPWDTEAFYTDTIYTKALDKMKVICNVICPFRRTLTLRR